MRRTTMTVGAVALVAMSLIGLPATGQLGPLPAHGADEADADFRILVFHETESFRHGSIPEALAAIRQLGAEHGFVVEDTDNSGYFTAEHLSRYAAVVWLHTDGDVLGGAEQDAFEAYIRGGGGYAGIHAASATEQDWPFYGELVGAYFSDHPAIQPAVMDVIDPAHPSTAHLPKRWGWNDEWYNFSANPRGDVHVLMSVDETTYEGGTMGEDHPIAWCHDLDAGRAFYTAIGHGAEAGEHYTDPRYLGHLLGGIQTAAGAVAAQCNASFEEHFVKTPIYTDTQKPIRLSVAPDGRLFLLEQAGQVRIYHPDTGEVTTAADFVAERGIFNEFENGGVGIAFDPDFADNQWVYLYYSPNQAAAEVGREVGQFGEAVRLSGGTDHVALPADITAGLDDFTVATWVNLDSAPTWSRIFDFGSSQSVNMFLTPNSGSGTLRYAITSGGNGAEEIIEATSALPTGRWVHVAVTKSGTTGTLYVDGQAVGTNPNMTLSPSDLGATPNNWIGRSQYPDPYLDGLVDEFQIFGRGLSATEVASLAQSATGSTSGGDVVRYAFDETGATAADSSGNGNDATIHKSAEQACPATEAANANCGELWLSRFTMDGDIIDLDSEVHMLTVAHQRDTCCHTTGDMTFDDDGNLYLSTGDDTNPWESSGYTPIDENDGRQAWDAQRTSANTNDLRGKILRIHPEDDGSYTIPRGNLFPDGLLDARPEIWTMGHRNPFTIDWDSEHQTLYVAEYGPDASTANPARGPEGQVELNAIRQAGNYGWPYCIGDNTPFVDFTFLLGTNGVGLPIVGEFDCDNPVNTSPNNTGMIQLPPAQPATLYQSYYPSPTLGAPDHAIGTGQSPMSGGVFDFDAEAHVDGQGLPGYYDGVHFWMDWNRGLLHQIRRDDQGDIRFIWPFLESMSFDHPQEMVQGRDGSLYIAEWGSDSFFGPNPNTSGVYRITFEG